MDMILFEVFLKSIDLIPQQQILQRHYSYIIDNVIVLSDLVESSGYSSKHFKKDHVHMRLWTRFYGIGPFIGKLGSGLLNLQSIQLYPPK